jgi:hypothetical protein
MSEGGNMNATEVAQKVVELTRRQAWHEAVDTVRNGKIVREEFLPQVTG